MNIKITKYTKNNNEIALKKYLQKKEKSNARKENSRRNRTSTDSK